MDAKYCVAERRTVNIMFGVQHIFLDGLATGKWGMKFLNDEWWRQRTGNIMV
jgi:hypothetical protein